MQPGRNVSSTCQRDDLSRLYNLHATLMLSRLALQTGGTSTLDSTCVMKIFQAD